MRVPPCLRRRDVIGARGSPSRQQTALPPLGRPALGSIPARARRRLTSLRGQRLGHAVTWSSATPPRRRRYGWPSTCCVIRRWTSRGTPPLCLGCVTSRPSWTRRGSRPCRGPPGLLRAVCQPRRQGPVLVGAGVRTARLLPPRAARQGARGLAARQRPPLRRPTSTAARTVGGTRTSGRPWKGDASFAAPPSRRRASTPRARPQGQECPRPR